MPLTLPAVDAPLHEWAQWYAAQSWPVFPCQGKRPLTPHGFHDATDDPFQLSIWWQQWPTANIGTPMTSERVVLDIDPRAGGDNTLFALERQHGKLPNTLLCHTGGGGSHYYFQPPPGMVNKADLGPGIDVQGVGSYVILPPSIHPETGRSYCWDVVDGPEDITPQPMPAWLVALVTAPQKPTPAVTTPAGQPIREGGRDTALTSLAGSLRHHGATIEEIRAALEAVNQRCVPPLAPADLDRIAGSVGRYAPAPTLHVPLMTPPQLQAYQGMPHDDSCGWGSAPPTIPLTDLADMLERQYPIPRWLIKNLIPEGLTFFVGSPKSSKTYLAYSLAISLAFEAQRGGKWLDQYDISNPGPVIYVSLEDDEADSRQRIAELAPWLKQLPRNRFLFAHGFELPRFGEGLLEALRALIEQHHPSLVVLDPISYLYAPTKRGADQFAEVKDMLLPLRWLGKEFHCSMLGVDHRRKKSAEDVDIFETTYGSNAKIAVADALLMVVRDDKEITIHARVRKAADQTLTLDFHFDEQGCAHWTFKGATDGLVGQGQYGDLRQQVMMVLSAFGQPMSVQDILAATQIPDSKQTRNAVFQILFRAQRSNEVQKTTRGQYVWCGGN